MSEEMVKPNPQKTEKQPEATGTDAPPKNMWARWAEMLGSLEPARRTMSGKTGRGGSRTYHYAPLEEIIPLATAAAQKYHFPFVQQIVLLDDGNQKLSTVVFDEFSGDEVTRAEGIIPTSMVQTDDHGVEHRKSLGPQDIGTWITYLRRYTLGAAYCIITEEDDDAEKTQKQYERQSSRRENTGSSNRATQEIQLTPGVHTVQPVDVHLKRQTQNWTLWVIMCEGGSVATFSSTVADLCDGAAKSRRPVVLTVEQRRGGYTAATKAELVTAADAVQAEDAAPDPAGTEGGEPAGDEGASGEFSF